MNIQNSLDHIHSIHRWNDGHVAFMRKTNGKAVNVGSFHVQELKNYFPQLLSYIIKDGYFTVNSMFAAAPYFDSQTGFPAVLRKEKHIRFLTAAYVDLDIYRKKLNWRDAASMAGKLMDVGIIPHASIIARSGRGMYLLWLLHRHLDETKPETGYLNRIVLYKQVNKELCSRLEALAADSQAIDAARVLRVPGSIHSGSQKAVQYMIQVGEDGGTFTYSLEELADFLNIKVCKSGLQDKPNFLELPGRKTKNKGSCPKRVNGLLALNKMRVSDLLSIEQYRGGFNKGFRHSMLNLYCGFLKSAGYKSIRSALNAMAVNCTPAYPTNGEANDTPISKIMKNCKPHRHTNKKLCKILGVTPEIAKELELKTILPPELKEKGGKSETEKKAEIRIEAIRKMVETYGTGYGCRKFVEALENEGIKTNRQTVNLELKRISLELNLKRLKPGRPAKSA